MSLNKKSLFLGDFITFFIVKIAFYSMSKQKDLV